MLSTSARQPHITLGFRRPPAAVLPCALLLVAVFSSAAFSAPSPGVAERETPAQRLAPVRSARVHFGDLARREALGQGVQAVPRTRRMAKNEKLEEAGLSEIAPAPIPASAALPLGPARIQVASPSPSVSFMGLDDIPMVDSLYIIIPPDVGGAVGPDRILEGLNNNYRVIDKATGATISTVGTATFWDAAVTDKAKLGTLTDPRTVYDPYQQRWIVAMQTFGTSADILIGVSETSDPAGAWHLYSFNTGVNIDFPNLGFNKNWISVGINRYSAGGTFQRGIVLAVDYPQARAGSGVGTIFTMSANTHFCTAPAVTYSATAETLYVVNHINSSGASYTVDRITGTPSSPVYTQTGALTRPGGGWVNPNGNQLPQSPPNSGSSACGATPCPIEIQDAFLRSSPVFRGGSLWYTQTVGLPSTGMTHSGIQWTRVTTPSGAFVEGGRLEDPAATANNGGKWFSSAHIGVNAAGDVMVGFSQFSSAEHPSAGYAMRLAGDPAGSLRDPLVFKAGEDYYHKTFSTATGRNRWGDFSTVQVDPVDDLTLWTVQEYAKARVSTDDGNTGANGSRWSTWWAAVGPGLPVATIAPGPSQAEGQSGTSAFSLTVNLSASSSSPVTVHYATSDGTATTADGDYQADTSSVVIPAGSTGAPIAIDVAGDTTCEGDETFQVTLTSATNATVGGANVATATIQNDDAKVITASAGTGGSISPIGAVPVACFGNQAFTIAADPGYHILDVTVDGGSVGALSAYDFTGVVADRTIAASFAADVFTLSLTSIGTGSLARSPDQAGYASGSLVQVTGTPGPGFAFSGWSGDATGSDHPLQVTMDGNKSITGTFLDVAAPAVAVVSPNGGESLAQGAAVSLQWTATDNRVVKNVDLALSRDGSGGTYESIAAAIPNTGSYEWTVTAPLTADAFVKVTARDSAGNAASDASDAAFSINGTTGVEDGPVTAFALGPVRPNPVSRLGTVTFALPVRSPVRLTVQDVQGRECAVLARGEYEAGRHQATWRVGGASARPGLYFVRLVAADQTLVRRAIVIR